MKNWDFGPRAIVEVRWLISLASGIAILPLTLLWLGLFPGFVGPSSMELIGLIFLMANLWVYRHQLVRFRLSFQGFKEMKVAKSYWFLGLFLLILPFQMLALPGLWVTPGDDAKLYSLITQRFIEVRGIPGDWGTYAPTNWYAERTHLLIPGFSSVVAFVVVFSGFAVPTVVSVLASLFRLLTAGTLYVLVWVLTRRRAPSVMAMFVYGFLVVEPAVNWFSWGGMAELSSLSLLPIAAAGTFLVTRNGITSKSALLWLSLVVGGICLLHPFVFFYYVAFVVSAAFFSIYRREGTRAAISWLPTLWGLGLASGPIVHAVPAELSIAESYSTNNPAWTPVFSWTMSINEALASLFSRVLIVYGFATVIFLLAGTILLWRFNRTQKSILAILGFWAVILFLLHENNPNGLFVVRFPLWYRVDSNRTFAITSLPVAIIVSLMLEKFRSVVLQEALRLGRPLLRSSIRWHSIRRGRSLVILFAIILVTTQLISNASLLYAARLASPIQPDDAQAFSWIETQTPANTTFFVNWADAGTWIPIYAARRVVLPFGVVTDYALLASYTTVLTAFIANPGNSTSLQFMKSTGAAYVYSGPGRIYGRPGFDPGKIIATGLFDEVYNVGSVWIFRLRSQSYDITAYTVAS